MRVGAYLELVLVHLVLVLGVVGSLTLGGRVVHLGTGLALRRGGLAAFVSGDGRHDDGS